MNEAGERGREKGIRGWIIVILIVLIGLGFFIAGEQAVDSLTESGQITNPRSGPIEE